MEEIMPAAHRDKRRFGLEKETLAVNFLVSRGVKLLARNHYCRQGEIDLVVHDQGFLVFVEVRYRKNSAYGTPGETVDVRKQARIVQCARHYLLKNPLQAGYPCRFDVIGISNQPDSDSYRYEWIRNAFQA